MTSLGDQLISTWSLMSYETRTADGAVEYPMGKEVVGFLIYAPPGFMSANLMIPGTPPFAGGDVASGSLGELAAAARGYFGYAGRFEVDESARAVKHHIEVSLVPNWLKTIQKRYIRLEGERLILSGDPSLLGGRVATPVITWARCR